MKRIRRTARRCADGGRHVLVEDAETGHRYLIAWARGVGLGRVQWATLELLAHARAETEVARAVMRQVVAVHRRYEEEENDE